MDMEDPGVNCSLNLALKFGSVVVKSQPPDTDAADASINSSTSPRWPMSVQGPGYSGEENTTSILGLQKVEMEDPRYGDNTGVNTSNSTTDTFTGYIQQPLEEHSSISEDEFVIMYSDDDSAVSNNETTDHATGRLETTGQSKQSGLVSTPVEETGTSPIKSGPFFEEEHDEDIDNGVFALAGLVDKVLPNDKGEEAEKANNADRCVTSSTLTAETQPLSEHGTSLCDEQRSVDEIQVVEEGIEDFEDGEVIKELGLSRHGTSSETFLSQMHFFGGRTWARGRGRRGRGRGRDITNIALKLIETDQMEVDCEQGNSFDEVGEIKTVTDSVRSGRGKSAGNKLSPALQQKRFDRSSDSKEATASSTVIDGEQSPRKEGVRGRGRAAGNRGVKGKQKGLGKGKPNSYPPSATENADDVGYESNDEDTLAAIKASLEDMNKNNSKPVDESIKDDTRRNVTEPNKGSNSKKVSSTKKQDSVKKTDKTKKIEVSKEEKKVSSTRKVDNPKKGDSTKKTDDKKRSSKTTGGKDTVQNKDKKERGRPSKQAIEIADNSVLVEVEYESNDEETQAAIRASLEELEKEQRRQRERDLENQKTVQKPKKGVALKETHHSLLTQTCRSESKSPESEAKISPVSVAARTSGYPLRTKRGKSIRGDNSARLSTDPKSSSLDFTSPSAERQPLGPESPDTCASDLTQQKIESISMKLKNRIQGSTNHEENEKEHSSDISDFDNVVDAFLYVQESPASVGTSISLNTSERNEQKSVLGTKHVDNDSSSVDISGESDNERTESNTCATLNPPANNLSKTGPLVKLQKLNPVHESSLSPCSSRSPSSAPSKRVHNMSDEEHQFGPSRSKVAKQSLTEQPSSSSQHSGNSLLDKSKVKSKSQTDHQAAPSQHPDNCSITYVTPALASAELPESKEKEDSLTKSVGGMMSYLFGDKLTEECPDGFVVNVRLEVEKKKDDDKMDTSDGSGMCCKTKKLELCPCLQKMPDARLASVLKERVEVRRDLTVGAKGSLLASILNFMQELEATSSPSCV